jgi:hypothetical protein
LGFSLIRGGGPDLIGGWRDLCSAGMDVELWHLHAFAAAPWVVVGQGTPGWAGTGAWVLVGLAALPGPAVWAWLAAWL